MPRKNLDRFSQVKPSISFYSKKNQRLMYCESHVEVGALLQLEYDTTVERYQTQPESFGYIRDGKKRRYTADVLVKHVTGKFCYEEVKTRQDAEHPDFIEKFNYLQWLFGYQIGVPLQLRIANAPHQCPVTGNLKLLYRYLALQLSTSALTAIRSLDYPRSLASICEALRFMGFENNDVYAAMAQGGLIFDKSQHVTRATMLELAHG